MPGEYGQVGSYVTKIKLVLPSGETMEVTEDQPELMQKVRCSYGTFGIVYEVTFRVRALTPLAVHHRNFGLREFIAALPELKESGDSMMFFTFPFDDKITVEFRRYNPGATGPPDRRVWKLRNFLWATVGPKLARIFEENISSHAIRYMLIDGVSATARFVFEKDGRER